MSKTPYLIIAVIVGFSLLAVLAMVMSQPSTPGPTAMQRLAGGGFRSCNTDAECAIRDVKDCCVPRPTCVNATAQFDPNTVMEKYCTKIQPGHCEKYSKIPVPKIESCMCVSGVCLSNVEAAYVRSITQPDPKLKQDILDPFKMLMEYAQ